MRRILAFATLLLAGSAATAYAAAPDTVASVAARCCELFAAFACTCCP